MAVSAIFAKYAIFAKSPLSKARLCHLICIFVYSLAILAISRQFCHFRQIRHFRQNRFFPKGSFAISFEFLFTVWRFWQLSTISAIFANASISGHISNISQASVPPSIAIWCQKHPPMIVSWVVSIVLIFCLFSEASMQNLSRLFDIMLSTVHVNNDYIACPLRINRIKYQRRKITH